MAVLMATAPPTSRSKQVAERQIEVSAGNHPFANLVGDVRVGAEVSIAPGTSIRAEEGTSFSLGDGSQIQEGAVIQGLAKGRVVGDDGQEYAVWIGKQSCIGYLSLIHGPAYIGDNCFIGFRSTVFNARVGSGSIVMMHTLIQDVEIPANKYVPSGAVITNQEQADRLPDVQESDRAFASHVVGMNEGFRPSLQRVASTARSQAVPEPVSPSTARAKETSYRNSVENMSISAEIKNQVHSLLSQGYAIGAEHANSRRFKTGSWLSCGLFDARREEQVLSQLAACLQDHAGEYVRLLGVDTKAKRRVLEAIVQRPGDTPGEPSRTVAASYSPRGNGRSQEAAFATGSIGSDVVSQVRSLLQQGYKIGTEYADSRRFKTSSWLTGPTVEGFRETDAIREIEAMLVDHEGEYVRLIGIDPAAKRRVLEVVIQRPGETSASFNGSSRAGTQRTATSTATARGSLSAETISQIRSLLSQGYKIGTEHADKRRFRTSSWQSCSPIDSSQEGEVIAGIEACLAEHQGEYVRLLGIDPKAKRRVLETVIQRPGEKARNGNGSHPAAASPASSYSPYSSAKSVSSGSSSLSAETISQIRSLLSQGYKIGTEHADKRRFRTSSWQSCSPVNSSREGEVVAGIEACLAEHQGEYVRLLGIDPKAKRRVLETVIQRP